VNLYRHTEFVRAGERELLDGLAVVVQLVLFPETPPDVVAGLVTCAPDEAARPPVPRPFAAPPTSRPDLGTRAQGTVRQLLDAGLAAFAAHGFRHANLDAVAADAGVARATLYKYFRDKASLLVALSEEAARAVIAEVERLPELYPPCGRPPAPADVRAWLDSYVAVNARYRGVLAVWFDEPEMPRSVRVAAAAASAHLYWGVAAFLGALDRPYPFHPQAAALVMLALLQRVPAGLAELFPDRPPADVARTMAVFVQRGLLNRAAAPADGRPLRPPHTRRERPRPDRTESTVHGGPRITHLDDLPWMVVSKLEFADGRTAAISEKWIEQTPRYVTYYNKWEPGAMVPNHGHHGDHIVFVLEGEMTCGDVVCGPGTHVTLDYGDTFGPWIAGPDGLVVFGAMFNFGAGGFGSPFAGDPEGWKALLAEKGATEVPVPPTPRTPWGTQASVLLNPETPQG
jgi:AcrR family transcriptional regulator